MKNFYFLALVLPMTGFAGTLDSQNRIYELLGHQIVLHDQEVVPEKEIESILSTNDTMSEFLRNYYLRNGPQVDPGTGAKLAGTRRGVHPKAHGCVMGKLQIHNLSRENVTGIFQSGAEYDTIVRFSNGGPRPTADGNEADTRGIGIKVLHVKGTHVLGDTAEQSQDFTLNSTDTFFADTAENYSRFFKKALLEKAIFGNSAIDYIVSLFTSLDVSLGVRVTKAFRKIQGVYATNPLALQYFSITPFQHGKHPYSPLVKYSVLPCEGVWAEAVYKKETNFLRKHLERYLETQPACFRFLIQKQTSLDLAVEDPTKPWEESVAPFIEVAQLILPQQKLMADDQCEKVVINPWNALLEHKPVGGINRLRLGAYLQSIQMRKATNHY
jgi:catalase